MRISDFEIESAAKQRFGCAQVAIVKYFDQDPWGPQRNMWLGLAIQRVEGGEWQTLCRRPTREKLLDAIERWGY
jgi:lipoprotein NlpI